MLIEINLIPEKDKKKVSIIIPTLIIILLAALAGFFLTMQYKQVKQDLSTAQNNIETVNELIALEGNHGEPISDMTELQNVVEWAENDPISTVFMLQELSALLPERGFIMNFTYNDDGSVQLTVQFDSNREIAFFLKNVNDSLYVSDATLTQVTTTEYENLTNETVVVPRYTADFVLMMDKDAMKKEMNREESE
ncbi:PilN domain-containing protein [Bacillus timonensis]|uniref:PilN domain-containing protein n=1 Tax=Bacillus timonensis TaxID=1033734 RepID=UPI000287AD44|nr:PilN domain-containing protein [Bacillus timonensis]